MKTSLIILVIIGIVVLVLVSCIGTKPEKENIVKNKCKEYLKNKYQKDFVIINYKQFFHGGHWRYETDVEAKPSDNQQLTFWLKYDAKNKKVKSDNYKKAYWENQIIEELKPIVEKQYKLQKLEARLAKNASLVFLNSDLHFYPNYREMAKNIELPVLNLTINIDGMPPDNEDAFDSFIQLSKLAMEAGFIKCTFSIYFFDNETSENDSLTINKEAKKPTTCKKQLLFKASDKLKLPESKDIAPLVTGFKSDSLFKKNKVLFEQAENERKNGNTQQALELYLKIVESVGPYRYSTYAPAEAACSVESAFYAAGIYETQNEPEKAQQLYQGIVDRMEYEEAKLNLSDFYKQAKEKLEKKE